MVSKCETCVSDKSWCWECIDFPIFQEVLAKLPKKSRYMYYIPVCPRGYVDCVYDPGYIKFFHPEWYKELYEDMSPEEAIHVENGCYQRFIKDPEMNYYYCCYDDEDK